MSESEQREATDETSEAEETEERTPSAAQQRRIAAKDARRRERAEAEAEEREAETERVHLKVFRYDPEVEDKREPRFDRFRVPRRRGLTVLDALIYARDHFDPSLTVRHSCRQAICGSDAVFINGRQRLACQTQTADLEEPIVVEPLPHQEVVKDLVVEMEHFYERMHAVEPYFQPDEVPDDDLEEQRQTPENREQIKAAARCIWCGACTSSCNIVDGDDEFLGPAAINAGYRFYMDEREGEDVGEHRLEVLGEPHGVWRCQTQFSCTEVCPKDIPLTEHIQELKRESVKRSLKFW